MEGTKKITASELQVGMNIVEGDGSLLEVLSIEPTGKLLRVKLSTIMADITVSFKPSDKVRVMVEDYSNGESMAHAN